MSLTVKNSNTLAENYLPKIMVYGPPGVGKTDWSSTADNPGFLAVETGDGKGMMTLAGKGVDYIEPTTTADMDGFFNDACPIFRDKATIVFDSISWFAKTAIKTRALAVGRTQGSSEKRKLGIPEMDDYGTMGELTRDTLNRLLAMPKGVIVTAGLREKLPSMETGKGQHIIGPDLPGDMFLTSTGMFDMVFRMGVEMIVKDGQKVAQRYLTTQNDGTTIAKCRPGGSRVNILEPKLIIDIAKGINTVPDIVRKVREALFK